MGADSICLKDMGGLMAPYDAFELVTTLKSVVSVPLQLHTHYTSGMASMTLLKAIEAGVDVVDTCLAPLALRTAQPAIEPLEVTLRGTDRDCGLDLAKILRMGDYLETILPKYRHHMQNPRAAVIDAKVLSHQIPGGMASNLISQLREADALDRLDEVLAEIPRTRRELGNPPLVTPISQMIGSQAVSNVLFGRYKMMSDQVKDYAYGMYGRSPASLDPQVMEMALKDYERGSEPYTGKPADLVDPEMEQARDAIKDISTDVEDVLTYALFPSTGLKFLRIKHGLDPIPENMKPKSLEQVEQEVAKSAYPTKKKAVEAPPKSSRARTFNVYVEGDYFEVEVDPAQPVRGSTSGAASPSAPAPYRAPAPATPTASTAPSSASGEATITAPMPGIVLRYIAEVGQSVQAGDPILVLEAMKMENTLPSPTSGVVKALPFDIGVTVAKDDILAIIAP